MNSINDCVPGLNSGLFYDENDKYCQNEIKLRSIGIYNEISSESTYLSSVNTNLNIYNVTDMFSILLGVISNFNLIH